MKKLLVFILACFMALSTFGCGAPATPAPAAAPTATVAPKAPAAGNVKYALLLKPLSNEYWSTMKAGVEDWAKKNNVVVDVYAAESEENLAGQLSQLEDISKKGYAGIGVSPLSPVNLIQGIVSAFKAGIPVVDVDEAVDFAQLQKVGGSMIACVTTDSVLIGEKGAKFIVGKLGAEGGKVAIIEGTGGNVTGMNRKKGAQKIFESSPNVKLVASQPGDWDRVKALDVATNIIQTNPDLKAFYCANDTMALGVFQAVQNSGKKIMVVGTDAVPGAVQSVKKGELAATVGQDPVGIAIKCVQLLIKAKADGYKADPTKEIPIQFVDSNLITIENAK